MEKERNVNLDLIRCVALLMVPTMHGLDHVDIYGITLSTPGDIVMMTVKILFTCCIPLWVLLSGSLCSRRTISAKHYLSYMRILVVYVICSLLCIGFDKFCMHEDIGLRYTVGAIVNCYSSDYAWYIMMYTGLFLMIPFLNLMYNSLSTKKQKLGLIATFFALSILPSLLNIYVQLYSIWWKNLYPITYYFTGAFLAEYMPRRKPSGIFAALAAFLAAYGLFFFIHYGASGAALIDVYQNTFPVYILSVLLFIGLSNLQLERTAAWLRKFFMRISDLSLAIYLCTWIPDRFIYPILMQRVPDIRSRYIWFPLTVLFTLTVSTLIAIPVMQVSKPLDKALRGLVMKAAAKIKAGAGAG